MSKFIFSCCLKGDLFRSPLILLSGLILTAILSSCEGDKNKMGEEYKGPVESITNVEFKFSERGKLKILMKTPRSFTYTNQNKVFPDSVNIDFYSPEGGLMTHLRADSGRYDHIANVYIVIGNVKVNKVDENKILTTSQLNWSPVTKKVFTDKSLVVRDFRTSEITNAVGMDADQDFSHIVFRKATGIYNFVGP
jgi:LPS export ABC transporter protein LptC